MDLYAINSNFNFVKCGLSYFKFVYSPSLSSMCLRYSEDLNLLSVFLIENAFYWPIE